jgi:hypothetical protein
VSATQSIDDYGNYFFFRTKECVAKPLKRDVRQRNRAVYQKKGSAEYQNRDVLYQNKDVLYENRDVL